VLGRIVPALVLFERGVTMATETETYHGSRERVAWSVTRNGSTLLFGDREDDARADYARRVKTLHKGETIRLERLVTAEAWVQHADVIEQRVKEA
jgi:hypothetical protein